MASAFKNAVFNDHHKMQRGENGCLEYTDAGIGSNILAISQMVRGGNPETLAKQILASSSPKDVEQLATLVFVTRNTRGGKGEKKLAYDLFLVFRSAYPETAADLLSLFPLYGYWKDIFLIMEEEQKRPGKSTTIISAAYSLIKEQWDKDLAALAVYKQSLAKEADPSIRAKLEKAGPKMSLLAKWIPREGKSLDKKLGFVKSFARLVYGEDHNNPDGEWMSGAKARYRKQVAELTSYLALPEVLLAAQRADEIQIERVASKATKNLTNAFLNEKKDGSRRSNDPKRIRLSENFIATIAEKGLKGGQLMPHEIVHTILQESNLTRSKELALDCQWKSLWKDVVKQVKTKADEEGIQFDPTRMVPLCDVSGSMTGVPMEVSIALGIGISEITHPSFRDMVLTFHSKPDWHRLNPTDSIVQKVRSLRRAPWGMNTDFLQAYERILKICRDHKLKREDMPSIVVFSDMQFDQATSTGYGYGYNHRNTSRDNKTMFETIRGRVKATAKFLGWEDDQPTPIVYWNLRNTGGHPVDKDTEGTVMLSGFSPSLLKLVMNGEALKEEEVEVVMKDGTTVKEKVRVTPEQLLRKMLDDQLYDPVREILGRSTEGALSGFEWVPAVVAKDDATETASSSGDGEDEDGFELM